jgi:hypothetical protein
MSVQLYVLNPEGEASPATLAEYDQWEQSIPAESKSAVGKQLKKDFVEGVVVITVFFCTPIGFFGKRPQLWMTMEIGPDHHEEHLYSSHRAALSGHSKAVRDLRGRGNALAV